eukprot:159510_1
MSVSEAVASRFACRDYLPKEVPLDLIMKILDEARRAPSSGNLQPWKIYLIHGENKNKLTNIIKNKMDNIKNNNINTEILNDAWNQTMHVNNTNKYEEQQLEQKYEQTNENQKKIKEYFAFDYWDAHSELFVYKKYATLKDEILNNKIYQLTLKQFIISLRNANKYFHTKKVKQMI